MQKYFNNIYNGNFENLILHLEKTIQNEKKEFIITANPEIIMKSLNDEERVKEQLKLFLDKKFKFHNCGAVGLNQITVQPNGSVCICQGDSRSSDTIVGNIITGLMSSF